METIQNIVLLPWTLFEWAFSLIIWYIIVSWTFTIFTEYGIDGSSIKNWFLNAWDDAKEVLKFRKGK